MSEHVLLATGIRAMGLYFFFRALISVLSLTYVLVPFWSWGIAFWILTGVKCGVALFMVRFAAAIAARVAEPDTNTEAPRDFHRKRWNRWLVVSVCVFVVTAYGLQAAFNALQTAATLPSPGSLSSFLIVVSVMGIIVFSCIGYSMLRSAFRESNNGA